MNSVESGIEACIRKIKEITHIKPVKSDLDIRRDVSELHETIDRSNAVDWRKICQDLLDDISNFSNVKDFCETEAILTLVSRLRREISSRYLQSVDSTPNPTDMHDDLESISLAGKMDGNSEEDDESDEVGELVELLWSRVKDLAISQLLDLNLSNVMDKEIFFQRVKLLTSVDNLDERNSIELYHLIRHQRMEKQVGECDKFPAMIERIKSCISNDLDLVENYHLFYGKLPYSQITSPYLIMLKDKVEEYMRIFHDDRVEPQNLLDILTSLHALSRYLAQCRLDLTSELSWTVQDSDESWDWRAYFVHLGIDNTLLRYLNQGLLQIMNDGLSSDHLSRIADETPPILIPCFCQVFQFLDCFQNVDLPGFQRSFSVIVNVSVIDFVLKVISRYSETNSIQIKYLLMNSVLYSQNQLAKWEVKSCRMLELSNTLRSEIRAHHLNRLMFVLKDISYSILYLKKLSFTLQHRIPEEPENESHVFIEIVKDYIHHLSKADLKPEDALIFCSSIIMILKPFADNIDDLLHRNFREIHSGCLMILLRLALHKSSIELIEMVSKSNDSNSPEPYDHQSSWMNFIDNSVSSTINNTSIVASHTRKPSTKHLIRPFLESRCALPTKIFTNILTNESDQNIASQLLLSIIRVAILNESQVNSISQLLIPIIQSNDHWSWLDVDSIFKLESQPFWLASLHTLFDEYASEFLVRIFPPFIYQHMLTLSVSEKYQKISKLFKDHHENVNEKLVFEEATKSLLSCITTIVSTLPLTLIASVEHLKNSCPKRINTLFSCLTGQMVYSAMIRFLSKPAFGVDQRFVHRERFFTQMNQAMTKIIHNKRICDFLGRNLSSVIEVKLRAKTSYVMSDESDQFSLIGELIDREASMNLVKDCLYNFIKSDRLKYGKFSPCDPISDKSESLVHEDEMENSHFHLLEEYHQLKSVKLHTIDDEQMKKLLKIANFRLSRFIIEGITELSEP